MTLKTCSERGNDVSSKAASCPKCGNPFAGAEQIAATGVPVTTTEATSKRFKRQELISLALCIIGLFVAIPGGSAAGWGGLMLFEGAVWYVVTRALLVAPRLEIEMCLPPNYAFERPGLPSAQARVRLAEHCAPSARLQRLRPAAHAER